MSVALKHLKKNGFNGASMSKIAADSHLAVGTLYLYFPNKSELLKSTVEDFVLEHRNHISKTLSSKKKAASKLKYYLKCRFDAVCEVRGQNSIDSELNQKIFELFPSRREEESSMMIETISYIINSGIQSGEFSMITKISDEIFVFMHAIAWFFLPSSVYDQPGPSFKDLDKIITWFVTKWTKP